MLLATIAVAIVMCASSCTLAGAPAGLIGIWEYEGGHFFIEFTNDDKMKSGIGKDQWISTDDIVKATTDTITVKSQYGSEFEYNYELSCDSLIFKDTTLLGPDKKDVTFKRVK